jgi:hypothetical protein
VEIENVSGAAISLAGHSLGVDALGGPLFRWPFRSDAQLGVGEWMLVYFGPMPSNFVPPPNSHPFPTPLNDDISVLTLRDSRDRIVDRIEYGLQLATRSIGRANQQSVFLSAPTPFPAHRLSCPGTYRGIAHLLWRRIHAPQITISRLERTD